MLSKMANTNPNDKILKPAPEYFIGGESNPFYKRYAEELSYLARLGVRSGIETVLANERYFAKVFNLQVIPYDPSSEWNNTQQYDYKIKKGYDDSWADRVKLYGILAKLYSKNSQKDNKSKYAEPAGLLEYMVNDKKDGSLN